jgi:hypothetical protein
MSNYTIASDKVDINAPREIVWDILFDLKRYPEWNPFTYRVDSTLQPGDPIDLYVRMPIRGDRLQTEQMKVVDRPRELSWGMKLGFEFLLKALREQHIEKVSESSCTYQTWDALSGLLMPLVIGLFKTDMQNGFNNMAYALKTRAEQIWAEKQRMDPNVRSA